MYIRLDDDEVSHERKVYHLMDLLGDVGGVKDILMDLAFFFFGGWLAFEKSIEFMHKLYYDSED